ncbi:hypothetical protein [Georgenia sp. SYP-B2076]|uniref:hypothetical protein n=1 Tax=Georgenia sp. SYP-B2076 TaxID=2495881 RepID=UPI000F8F1B8D|nr:hypothetical protein [Georgenia sp. SYP-B2076]
MELQGYVFIALTLVLLGYLLPNLVRSRQLLLDSRVEDRFSGDLRILATAGTAALAGRTGTADGGTHHAQVTTRPYLHDPSRRPESSLANRPHAPAGRAPQDARALAAARAARAARVSRRAAAARRRLILTTLLLVVSVGAWAAVPLVGASWLLPVVPTLLLVMVLVLGRRTAVQALAHDKRDRAEMARLQADLREITRRAAAQRPPSRRVASAAAGRARGAEAGASADADASAAPGAAADASTSAGTSADASATPGRPADAGSLAVDRATADRASTDSVAVGRAPAGPASADRSASTDSRRDDGEDDLEAPAGTGRPDTGTDVGAPPATAAPDTAWAERGAQGASHETWTPVPVPVPSYTLKPDVPRRDVAPYADAAPDTHSAVPQRPTVASPASAAAALLEPVAVKLDLDAVLARRRAAGE